MQFLGGMIFGLIAAGMFWGVRAFVSPPRLTEEQWRVRDEEMAEIKKTQDDLRRIRIAREG